MAGEARAASVQATMLHSAQFTQRLPCAQRLSTSRPALPLSLDINSKARKSLINQGGIIEECFSPGKGPQHPKGLRLGT